MNTSSSSVVALSVAFVLLWNSGFISAEYGLPYAGPFTLLFWRYWALTLILLGYLAIRDRFKWPGMRVFLSTAAIGILAHAVWLSCVLVPIQKGVPAGIVALIVALQPMATGAFAGWFLGEQPRPLQWAGLFIGFGGVALAVGSRIDLTDLKSLFHYAIPLGSVMAITVASLIQRWIAIRGGHYRLPITTVLLCQSLGTAVAISVPAIAVEGLATQWNPTLLSTLAWLVLVVSLLSYGLMWMLIIRSDATRVASLFYLGPPVTMIMAWATLGDTPQLMDFLGLFIVAVGVLLVQRSTASPEPKPFKGLAIK